MAGALVFLYAETPVHAGASESLGGIDLPIQRESSTGLPVIWGESLKGALREAAPHLGLSQRRIVDVFGSEPPRAGGERPPASAGRWSFGDVRLVAFPVPTLQRTFAWVTSPLALERLRRCARLAGIPDPPPDQVPQPAREEAVPAGGEWGEGRSIVLGDFDFTASSTPGQQQQAADWAAWLAENALPQVQADYFAYFSKKLQQDLLVVHDEALASLTESCAEVVARVQLGSGEQRKTVQHGPWYVEYLPAEALLVSYQQPLGGEHADHDWPGILDGKVIVLGGEATVGKGLLWCRVVRGHASGREG